MVENKDGGMILGGLALWALLRGGDATSGVSGTLRLQLLDESGKVVSAQGARMGALTWNPFGATGAGPSTIEGRSYTLRAIVTNRSTKDGLPINVTFQVSHSVMVGTTNRLNKTQNIAYTGMVTQLNADGAFTLAVGDAGQAGVVTVVVRTPEGIEVARASDTFTIGSSAISYSATVSLTPISSAEDYLAQIAAATSRTELEAIYAAASAAAGRGEISTTQIVVIFDAYMAKAASIGSIVSPVGLTHAALVSWYKQAFSLPSLTAAEKNALRFGGTFRTVAVTGYEPDYRTEGRLNYDEYIELNRIDSATVTVGNRPRSFASVLAGVR